ncbi:transcriptional regulator [Aneurinibacillus migulanus]|uniref:sigma-54-dependent Fis family transcriptional regulator n=1 Tax=Aneurinibacillus migulanus TaxID=47500 RepID=UPI0005B8DDAC|nr:sigma-54-dependent Fis family transcriptional regulator [Aneurinibacillus migulanus]KIV53694.1 transcriptional regulator [Aneurinibacillus migulanus]KPD08953.1 transcriptional regulator [Aneurinibacillus migulanus]CEH30331.1 Transcriptional activator of acetoin/glycerol met abolism [Aneurinibacillus migulanus]
MTRPTDTWLKKSWERSQRYKVDPSAAKYAILEDIEFKQYRKQKEMFLREINPTLERLSSWLKASHSIAAISDNEGYILESIGDPMFLQDTEKIHVRKGACWSEHARGTNSAGTAIVEQKPIAVVGKEHYLETNHMLYCTASPIFDPAGNLLAALNISGYRDKYHPSLLGIVDAIARELEDWILIQRSNKQLLLTLQSEHENKHRALITVNAEGVLTGANREARGLLQLSGETIGHVELSELFSGVQPLLFQSGKIHTRTPVTLCSKINEHNRLLGSVLFDTRPSFHTSPKKRRQNSGETHRTVPCTFGNLYGTDNRFLNAIRLAKKAAATDYTILITGESGTGKDMVSQAIHEESRRSGNPFVAINCGAVTKSLLESELFGYEAGAFTGARQSGQPGKFELAHGGTLFLDEIAEMPPEMQVALLRVLQNFTITRIGGSKSVQLDVRIIAATHTDLWGKVQDGSFRADLFYRLQGIHIMLPPLREREDRLQIARFLLRNVQEELQKESLSLSLATEQLIKTYVWPGNIRQMFAALREAAFLADSNVIEPAHFPSYILSEYAAYYNTTDGLLKQSENHIIMEALKKTGGNISQAALALGIGRSTLYRKLKKLAISDDFT